jgi:hypothetical protein
LQKEDEQRRARISITEEQRDHQADMERVVAATFGL